MPKNTAHLTGLIKQVINLVKYTFLLLVTIIALLTGALVILFNLYQHEKKDDSRSQQKTEATSG